MKIAILIGVSTYVSSSLGNLDGCQKDIEIIYDAINLTNKFDEVLVINKDTDGLSVKQQIAGIIAKYTAKPLEEIFFYFTGHGEFYNDEFYYILSDFDKTKRKKTALENTELDQMFRSLKPELVVKVVDACQSGIAYVKGDNSFDKYLKSAENQYDKCYFIYSSQSDQSSYQTDLSDFTRSFINAITSHGTEEIRYKDIIDHISDEFEDNLLQSPFFISQANFTEKFGTVTRQEKLELSKKIDSLKSTKSGDFKFAENTLTLKELVQIESEEYFTKEEVLDLVSNFQHNIESYQYPTEFTELFQIEKEFQENFKNFFQDFAPRLDLIGKWLTENKHEYFAIPVYGTQEVEVEEETGSIIHNNNGIRRTVKKKIRVVRGFDVTLQTPYKMININAIPKYQNLPYSNCKILFMCSKTKIRLFYFCANYIETNWDERELPKNISWKTVETKIKDEKKGAVAMKNILNEFMDFILDPIKEKYKKPQASEESHSS